jgi:hypothetical protein
MIRYLIIAILFLLIVKVVRDLARPSARQGGGAGESLLVQDAQTGVYFDKSKAVTVVTGGSTYYFSSQENRDLWLRQNSG